MTKLNATLVSATFSPLDYVSNSVNDAAKSGAYGVDMTDCKEELLLIVNASAAASALTLTVSGGTYAMKCKDMDFVIPAGSTKVIALSSGETVQSDGMAHLTFTSGVNLNTLGVTVAVLKKRFVTNH